MSNLDVLTMSLRNLMKRKIRTFLTVLGVIIGSTAITLTLSISIGINETFKKQMETMQDATIITIYNYDNGNGNFTPIDDTQINKFKQIKGVAAATPYIYFWLYAKSGAYTCSFNVVGVDPTVLQALGYTVAQGSYLDPNEPYGIVLGSEVPYNFTSMNGGGGYNWGPQSQLTDRKANVDVFKDKIQVSPDYNFIYNPSADVGTGGGDIVDNGDYVPAPYFPSTNVSAVPAFTPYEVKVLGLMQAGDKYESTQYCFMNVNTVIQMRNDYYKWQEKTYGYKQQVPDGYDTVYVKCDKIDDTSTVAAALKDMGYENVYYAAQTIDTLKDMMKTLQLMLSAIGAVSFFVAAIGIANTMITATYERTREIGIMKVIGAALKDIRKLFLLEAAFIGLFGGILGCGLSFLLSYLMNSMNIEMFQKLFSNMTYGMMTGDSALSVIPAWLALAAMGFSAVVGLVSGFLPAIRATKLSALSAIRTE